MKKHFLRDDAANDGWRPKLHLRGLGLLFRRILAWNLAHPPLPERIVIRILNHLKVRFERGKYIGSNRRTMSFYLPETRQAIQVQGLYSKLNRRKPRTTGPVTIRELLKQERIHCLFLSDTELLHDDLTPVIGKISDFMESSKTRSESR